MIKSIRNNRGFTLVEVMAAVVILLVGLLGLLQSVNIITDMNLKNQLRDEATQVGDRVLNELMAAPYDALAFDNRSTVVPSGLRGINKNYKVTGTRNLISSSNSRLVTVTVKWDYKGVPAQHVLSAVKTSPSQ
jgi:type IV pilus assembly protein PilV